jgi:hypothetical protein
LQLLRQNAPVEKGDLGRTEHGEVSVRRAPFGEQAARLHGDRGVPLDREFFTAHVSRIRKSARRVAAHAAKRERTVRARAFEQQDLIGQGGGAGDDRRQRVDGDADGIERVLSGGGSLGQHHCDGLADIADLVVGDDGLLERLEGRGGILPQRNGRNRGADLGRRDDGVHARPCPRCGDVDGADPAVRHRAAQDHGMQQILACEIVDELAAPAQQPQILDALDRAPDEDIGPALLVHFR